MLLQETVLVQAEVDSKPMRYICIFKTLFYKCIKFQVPAIRVSNISSAATQEDLSQLFEKFGRINRIHLGRDRRTNESRGFAFINYANRDDAQKVCFLFLVYRFTLFSRLLMP